MRFKCGENVIDRAPVEVEVDGEAREIGDVIDSIAELKRQLEPAARTKDTGRLGEGEGERVIGDVDRRVPGDEAGERIIGIGQGSHRPDVEPERRIETLSEVDHGGGEVESARGETESGEERGDTTRTAADVEDLR